MNSKASEIMLLELERKRVSADAEFDKTLEQTLKQKLMKKKGLIKMKKVLSEWDLRIRLRTWNRIIQHRQGKYELEEGEILDIHVY
jgi:hypothetical protein